MSSSLYPNPSQSCKTQLWLLFSTAVSLWNNTKHWYWASWTAQDAAVSSTGKIPRAGFYCLQVQRPQSAGVKCFVQMATYRKETKGLLRLSGIFVVFTRYPQSCGQIPAGLITIIIPLHIPPATTNGYRACFSCFLPRVLASSRSVLPWNGFIPVALGAVPVRNLMFSIRHCTNVKCSLL